MPKPVTLWQVWEKAILNIRVVHKPIIQLGSWTLIVPQLILSTIATIWSGPLITQIHLMSEDVSARGADTPFTHLLETTVGFFSTVAAGEACLSLISIATFQAFIFLAINAHKNPANSFSGPASLKQGLRALPRGILLTIGVSAMLGLDYLLFGGFPVLSIFSLVGFVISAVENRGALASLQKALLFKYTSPATGGGFAVGLILVVIGALSGLFIQSIQMFNRWMQHADEWLNLPTFLRQPLTESYPLSPLQIIPQLITSTASVAYIATLAFLLVSIFFQSARTSSSLLAQTDD